MPYADGDEDELVETLRHENALSVSLVAELADTIVGVFAGNFAGSPGWYARTARRTPAHQRAGVGAKLVHAGLDAISVLRHGCILTGNPRTTFASASDLRRQTRCRANRPSSSWSNRSVQTRRTHPLPRGVQHRRLNIEPRMSIYGSHNNIHDRTTYAKYGRVSWRSSRSMVARCSRSTKCLCSKRDFMRTVLLEFASEETANAWYHSENRVGTYRYAASHANIVLIKGPEVHSILAPQRPRLHRVCLRNDQPHVVGRESQHSSLRAHRRGSDPRHAIDEVRMTLSGAVAVASPYQPQGNSSIFCSDEVWPRRRTPR